MASDFEVRGRVTLKDEASPVAKRAALSFASLGSEIKSRLVVTAGDLVSAFRGVVSIFGDAIKAFAEAEAASAKLAQSLSKLGPSARDVAAGLEAQAAGLQKTSVFADDAIVAGQALLATFTQNEEQLRSGTEAAVNFAAATGVDLQTAFLLLGKAAAGNTAALSRYGVVIEEGLGSTEKFAAVVDKLQTQFGGQASAQAQTFAGKVEILKNQFNDTQEILGGLLVRFSDFLGALGGGGTVLDNVNLTLKATGDAASSTSGYFSDLGETLNLFWADVTGGFAAGDALVANLNRQKEAAAAAAEEQARLAEEQLKARQAAAEAEAAAKKTADALKLLDVQSTETADAMRTRLLQALIELKVQMQEGALAPEVYAKALENFRAKLDELDPAIARTNAALKLLGVESSPQLKAGLDKVNEALRIAKAEFDAGRLSVEAWTQAQRNATEAAAALGDKVAQTNLAIAENARQAVEAQEALAKSFQEEDEAAEAHNQNLDETADGYSAVAEAANEAAAGIRQVTMARSEDARTDAQIAADNLAALDALGPFASAFTPSGISGDSLGVRSALQRKLAAAKAAEGSGPNVAGSTVGIGSKAAMGTLAGGTRSLAGR